MAGFRNFFTHTFHPFGKLISFESLINLTGQRVIVPVYHVISDEDLPHIKHLYPVKGVSKFKEDLDFLLKHYKPIDYSQLQKIIQSNSPLNENYFLLTFDDGLREFYDVIAPILKKKGVPALCFLNSAFVDNQNLFFRYKASLVIGRLEKDKNWKIERLKDWFVKRGGAKNFRNILLSVSYQQKEILDELATILEFDFTSWLREQQPYLTTSQISSLIKDGFHFGAHSKDHPEYRFINLEEQLSQTEQSVDFIGSKFSLGYKLFAFPFTDFGVSKKFFETLYKRKTVDLSFGSAGLKHDGFPKNIQRIPLEIAELSAKEILRAEYLYFMLKAPFGKNKIQRS